MSRHEARGNGVDGGGTDGNVNTYTSFTTSAQVFTKSAKTFAKIRLGPRRCSEEGVPRSHRAGLYVRLERCPRHSIQSRAGAAAAARAGGNRIGRLQVPLLLLSSSSLLLLLLPALAQFHSIYRRTLHPNVCFCDTQDKLVEVFTRSLTRPALCVAPPAQSSTLPVRSIVGSVRRCLSSIDRCGRTTTQSSTDLWHA